MANQIVAANGNLSIGGAALTASGGTKLAVFYMSGSGIVIYSDIDGTPNLEDSDTDTTVFNGTGFGSVAAALDSNDNIHLLATCGSIAATRDVAYAIATESAGSWTIGSWELVASYTDAAPSVNGCSISIDSNDKPHVLYTDGVTLKGTTADEIYYTEKTGASWSSPVRISDRANKEDGAAKPFITIKASNDAEAIFRVDLGATAHGADIGYVTRTSGSWGSVSYYPHGSAQSGGVTVTSGGTVYRTYTDGNPADIRENGTDTGYDSTVAAAFTASPTLNGTDRYIIFSNVDDDIQIINNTGSGWTNKGTPYTGTADYVIAQWSYLNNNQTNLNYIFEAAGSAIYWDEYSLGTATSSSRSAYTKGQDTASDNREAYIAGGVNVSDNRSAYINGALGASDNREAYIHGLDTASDNREAYIAGGVNVSDSRSAYIVGALGASDNREAYIQGQDTASDNREAYIHGVDTASDNREAYIQGQDTASDNREAYIHGQDTTSDNREAYIAGGVNVSDSRSAYIQGDVLDATDNRQAYIHGQDTATDNRSAYIAGSLDVSDSREAYIAGGVNVSDNREAYIHGLDTVSDNREAYIHGQDTVSDNREAYIHGQDTASDNREAYIAGGVNVSDNRSAFIFGASPASSSRQAYIEGLYLPLPVTEPWTGANGEVWRISHWVTEVVE